MSETMSTNKIDAVVTAAVDVKEIDQRYIHLSRPEQGRLAADLVDQARGMQPIAYAADRAELQDQQQSKVDFLAEQIQVGNEVKNQRPPANPYTAENAQKGSEDWFTLDDGHRVYKLGFRGRTDQ
jgi:hypothetical protein